MPPEPLVSVAMTVLNPHPEYFPAAVASVLGQTYKNLELIIVEDPSPQSAADLLHPFSDPRIILHRNRERTSHSQQRNLSLELARADLVAIMDADDVCLPNRIAKQVEYLHEHREIDVLGSQLTAIDASGRPLGTRRYPTSPAEIHGAFPLYNPIAQPSVMFRKTAVMAAGGYQYDRFPAVEDYELWSRLASRGVKFANHSEALLQYRLHPGGMKATRLKGILRGTIDVKLRHWRAALGWRGNLRLQLERALLLIPPTITYRLFTAATLH
jgi:glycosyltransferase involved in cell wall biosynthesis